MSRKEETESMQNDRPGDDELLAALEEAAAAAERRDDAATNAATTAEPTGEVVYPARGPRNGGNGEPAPAATTAIATELEETRNRLLRSAADFDNYRKRMQREREETVQFANEAILRDLLPVLDNLERAVESGRATHDSDTLYEGVRMVVQQFHALLDQYGVRRVPGVGEPFDPAWHEAVQQMPAPEYPPGTVVEELQAGYMYRERLLRPALVIVSAMAGRKDASRGAGRSAPAEAENGAGEGESDDFEEDTLPQADLPKFPDEDDNR